MYYWTTAHSASLPHTHTLAPEKLDVPNELAARCYVQSRSHRRACRSKSWRVGCEEVIRPVDKVCGNSLAYVDVAEFAFSNLLLFRNDLAGVFQTQTETLCALSMSDVDRKDTCLQNSIYTTLDYCLQLKSFFVAW